MASNVRPRRGSREQLIVWSSLCLVVLYGVIGAAVSVPFGDQGVSLSEALGSISFRSLLGTNPEWLIILTTAVITCVGYFGINDLTAKLVLLFAGFLIPPCLISEALFVYWIVSPLMIFAPVSGANGEFYSDQMPLFTAGSLWMLMCAALLYRCVKQMMHDYEAWMAE